jgi:hypothetical protein
MSSTEMNKTLGFLAGGSAACVRTRQTIDATAKNTRVFRKQRKTVFIANSGDKGGYA